jgi:hypothetical protein
MRNSEKDDAKLRGEIAEAKLSGEVATMRYLKKGVYPKGENKISTAPRAHVDKVPKQPHN